MSTVLLVLQLILSAVLTVLVLLQRSEGGALGIGGGGGGFMSGRSATTSIVRLTSFVGVLFILNCVALTIFFNLENNQTSITEQEGELNPLTQTVDPADSTVPSVDDILLPGGESAANPEAPDTPVEDEEPRPE